MPSVLQVFIFRSGEFQGTDIFAEQPITIGRDPEVANLVLESSQVSRKHATLEFDDNKIQIKDLGSTNGIYVNNNKVDSAEVTRLDEILIGEFSLKLKLVSKSKPAENKPDENTDVTRTVAAQPPSSQRKPFEKISSSPSRIPIEREPEERPFREAVTSAEVPESRPKPAPAAKKPEAERPNPLARGIEGDLSDWDDVPSEEIDKPSRAPKADFRPAKEPLDDKKFDRVLKGMGIAAKKKPQKEEEDDEATAHYEPQQSFGKRKPAPPEIKEEEEEEIPQHGEANDEVAENDGFEVAAPPLHDEHDEDDDEHEEDDDDFVPPYSLVALLLADDGSKDRNNPNADHIEVMAVRDERIVDISMVQPGGAFWIGPKKNIFRRGLAVRDLPPRVKLVQFNRGGQCFLELPKKAEGSLQRGRERIPLEDYISSGKPNHRRGTSVLDFKQGELLKFHEGLLTYHVRYVRPPPQPKDTRPLAQRIKPQQWFSRSFGGSIVSHILIAVVVTILTSSSHSSAPPQEEFHEVSLDNKLNLEEPPPEPPKEEPPPEPEPEVAAPEKVPQHMQAAPSKSRPKAGGTSKAPPGVLGLLSKKGSSAAPGPAAAVAAVSNLSAASAPGVTSGYRVSGLISKLPGSTLSVGGGGGGLMTKGGAALLRGGGGGAGVLSGKGTREVGGLVQKMPKAMRATGQGTLDRDEIQKVINANIGAIQRCYERELLKTPGLSGKVQVEWNIGTSGSVRGVRQTFSNLNNNDVVNCIMSNIKSWQFPQPKGGEVVVNYPFIFKSIGF